MLQQGELGGPTTADVGFGLVLSFFYFLNHRTFQEEPLGFFQVGKDFWFVFVPLSLDDGFPAERKPWNDAIYRWGVLAN